MSSENAITTTKSNEINVQQEESMSRSNSREMGAWTYRPDADIIEFDDSYRITMDVPGVRGQDVDLSIDRDVLTIHARVNHGRTNTQRQWMRQEYGVGDYFRRFQLAESINIDAANASCEHGVLTITLPKHEAARPKRITVSARKDT